MNKYVKLICHILGFIASYFICVHFFSFNEHTVLPVTCGMCLGYIYCFLESK